MQYGTMDKDQPGLPEGDLDLDGYLIKNLGDPEESQDAATKSYVDSKSAALDWQESVINEFDNPPIILPAMGARYIVGPDPTGTWIGHAKQIATHIGGFSYTYQTPNAGWACFLESPQEVKIYGAAYPTGKWKALASFTLHADLEGLDANDHPQYLLVADQKHGIAETDFHDSSITEGKMIKADLSGLPSEASNTDTEVAAAVSATHARSHAMDGASDHSVGVQGDILYAGASGVWTRLPVGIDGQRLACNGPGADPSWSGIQDIAWTPIPQGKYGAQGVQGAQSNYMGAAYYLSDLIQFNRILVKLTAATPIGATGRVLIMQTDNGKPGSATNLAKIKATCNIALSGTGTQNMELTPSEGTVNLKRGIFYILWGEIVAALSFRAYATQNYDLLNQSMQAGYTPDNFTTNIATSGVPGTFNPLETGSGGQSTASVLNTAIVARFRKV